MAKYHQSIELIGIRRKLTDCLTIVNTVNASINAVTISISRASPLSYLTALIITIIVTPPISASLVGCTPIKIATSLITIKLSSVIRIKTLIPAIGLAFELTIKLSPSLI